MALTSLEVCAEDESVAVLRRVLQDLDIKVEVSRNPKALLASPPGRRFDAVVVDCQDEASSLPLIAHFRQTTESGTAVVIVLVNSQTHASEVFGRGAHFLLWAARGMLLCGTPEPFPQGAVLTSVVRTPEGKLCVAGKVESMHLGYGMGVRFALANEGERTRVAQLIARAEPEPPGKV